MEIEQPLDALSEASTDATDIFRAIDANDNGTIGFQEFADWSRQVTSQLCSVQSCVFVLDHVFSAVAD